MQEVLKTYSNHSVRTGIAHQNKYMYMAQQVFVLKVWVISHGHILTEIMQKTKQNLITNFWNAD